MQADVSAEDDTMRPMGFRWRRHQTEVPASGEQSHAEDLGGVLLEEARWLYEDRRSRSEAVQAASTGLVSSFATVLTLPPVVVALIGQATAPVRWLMTTTILASIIGMFLAVMATNRMKHASKDLNQVQTTFDRLLNPEGPCAQDLPELVRKSLAENLIVEPAQDGRSIVQSLSRTSDRQILWYQAARWALVVASLLAGLTLIILTMTIR